MLSCGKSKITEVNPNSEATDTVETKPFANPFYGNGSDFGHLWQAYLRQNKFEELLKLTSSGTRQKFGDQTLIEFYKEKFQMDFELGKLTSMQKIGDTLNLIYNRAQLIGTRRKIAIQILIESDTCKIVIQSLKNPFKYLPE